MWLYILIFFVVFFLYTQAKTPQQQQTYFKNMMIFLALFVGLSDMLGGYDRYIYGELFDSLAETRISGSRITDLTIYALYKSEWFYIVLNYLISFITANRYIFIFIVTCVIYACLYKSLKQYTSNPLFALILFLGLWYFFTFTYLRQVLAATIGWLSVKYVLERKPWHFAAVVFLAYGFHNSAIMLAPLYFVPIRRFNKRKVAIFMMGCFALGLTNIVGTLFETFAIFANQEERLERSMGESGGLFGLRIAYIIEAAVFLWFIFKNYYTFNIKDKREMLLMNMALIFCAILLIFMRSENGGRISWFYMIGIIACMTDIATKRTKNANILICMSALLYIRIVLAWGILLSPYKTFFTDGHRDGDHIYQRYEYDAKYDKDKLYKL